MSRLVLCRLWMRNKYKIAVAVCLVLLVAALPGVFATQGATAQKQGEWSPPFRLSTEKGKASEAFTTVDQHGFVHVFWSEVLADDRSIIQYARFDGNTWSTPVDVYVSQPFGAIGNISPVVDQQDTLHLVWIEGLDGPAYYTSAPASYASSAQNWQRPHRIAIRGNRAYLQVDGNGHLHILYIKFLGEQPGVYYTHSRDSGLTWQASTWLDPDILAGHVPRSLNFILDEAGRLHAAWYYVDNAGGGDWVRYAHSLDGGRSWSIPFTIDRLEENNEESDKIGLSAADPVMAVQGQNVHIIWAGGELHYRNHRFSEDAGKTWSRSTRVFGNLNGQAFDGMAVDSLGRVHFVGQIRFPQGIYHAIWEEDRWTQPSLVYLIRNDPADVIGDHIHAHNTYPVIRDGNQLVLTFADPPPDAERRLFVMYRTLEDAPALGPVPTPTLPVTLALEPSPTPSPTVTPLPPSFDQAAALSTDGTPSPDRTIWFGLVPALLLIAATVVTRLLSKSRH